MNLLNSPNQVKSYPTLRLATAHNMAVLRVQPHFAGHDTRELLLN
jgi:hypothetical protein